MENVVKELKATEAELVKLIAEEEAVFKAWKKDHMAKLNKVRKAITDFGGAATPVAGGLGDGGAAE